MGGYGEVFSKMANVRKAKRSRFTSLSNGLLQDSKLSFSCRGMMAYLLSKPTDWEARPEDIEREGGIGRDARRAIMREAEAAGYLTFHTSRKSNGQFENWYDAHEEPVPENERTASWETGKSKTQPGTENPQAVKAEPGTGLPPPVEPPAGEPTPGQPVPLIKKEVQSTELQNTEGKPAPVLVEVTPDGITDALEEIYPGHATNFRTIRQMYDLVLKLNATAADVRRFPAWLEANHPKKADSPFAFLDLFSKSLPEKKPSQVSTSSGVVKAPANYADFYKDAA